MSKYFTIKDKNITDFDAVRLSIASSDDILDWSHGEVTKAETINYRTQKAEKDGLFDERIFGPTKDYECYCGKYKGIHHRGVVCDRCGVQVTRSVVRRERMGHISLAVPCTHIWFLRGAPSSIGLLLNTTVKNLEKVVYYASYLILDVDEKAKEKALEDLEAEVEAKEAEIKKRFEGLAEQEEADMKKLAEQQTKEVDELQQSYKSRKKTLESLVFKQLLTEQQYRDLDKGYRDLIDVEMGAKAIKKVLEKLDLEELIEELQEEAEEIRSKGQRRKKLFKRLKMLESMHQAGIKPEWMVLNEMPVIPPDLRPMVQLAGGRFATSDMNDLYRRVINRNNRLKKLLDLNAPEVICRNEMRMLQEAVDALIDNNNSRGGRVMASTGGRRRLKSLSDLLKGKQGRFRQNLLGKRVDYSGRSVIVSGPDLKIDQCGLPKMMALELFKPFVVGKLIENGDAHNVRAASRLIELGETEVWDALDEVIEGKYVLLNRAPTLHRLGVQAFKPILIEGKAIQLHPLVCGGFNADFDGDQMAVHLPLSEEAQLEAKEIMAAQHNILKPADGSPILSFSQDIVLGLYYMTFEKPVEQKDVKSFSSVDEVIFAFDKDRIKLHEKIHLLTDDEVVETTTGRVFFNEALPEDYPYQNETLTKKGIKAIFADIFETYGKKDAARIADDIKNLGFGYATKSGITTGIYDYHFVEGKDDMLKKGEKKVEEISDQFDDGLITEDERSRLTIEAWNEVNEDIADQLEEQFTKEISSTSTIILSGARGDLGQLKQMTGSVGLMADATGNTIELPINSTYLEGLSALEYFTQTRGSRKGLISTALKTADSGYLTRRLVDVSQDVFTYEDPNEELGEGTLIQREEIENKNRDFMYEITGRCAAEDIKDKNGEVIVEKHQLIKPHDAEVIDDQNIEEVRILTVFDSTRARGINRLCYGADLATSDLVEERTAVGVIAAQAIGEPGTQLTLDEFHSGGVATTGGEATSQGLARVEELFEARTPKGQAVVSGIEGRAKIREEENRYVINILAGDTEISVHKLDELKATIKNRAKVKKGDVIAVSKDKKAEVKAEAKGKAEVTDEAITIVHEGGKIKTYTVPAFKELLIKDGEIVSQGQQLTRGSIDVKELYELRGEKAVQEYIMDEILAIFNTQGITISRKYIETVVRQMFSRVQIEEPGDSLLATGDIVSRAAVQESNLKLAAEGKEPATFKQLLLGITKVSTKSDSFLAAASFQDTTRVLIGAATSGSIDQLRGLKENVIIGRKIPVGTGWNPITEVDEEE